MIEQRLLDFPAVALLGPRHCGKTTLVLESVGRRRDSVYLDLERPSDLRKLGNPELYFQTQRARREQTLFCLDESSALPSSSLSCAA